MTTEPDHRHHELTAAVPVIEIHRVNGTVEIHPADRAELINPTTSPSNTAA